MKKLFIILLTLCLITGVCACKGDAGKASYPQSSGDASEKEQPIITAAGVNDMAPVIEGLIYAQDQGDYSAGNKEYVWRAFAYIVSNYGYGTLGNSAPSGVADTGSGDEEKPEKQTLTIDEADILMHACFGKDAKLPKSGFDKYFTEKDGVYTLRDTIAPEKLRITISRVSASGGKAAVSLKNSEGAAEEAYSVYFEQSADESSPYPVNITDFEENLFG